MLRTLKLVCCLLLLLRIADGRSANGAMTIVFPVATTALPVPKHDPPSKYERGEQDYDEAVEEARGMSDYTDHDHDHVVYDDPHKEEMKEEKKAVKTDPWAGYYDFIINEGSFKFWAAFQLATALLLVYSACAAIYYAKLNPVTTDYDYYDDFLFRSMGRSASGDVTPLPAAPKSSSSSTSWFGLDSQTFQRILSAITSKKFS